MTRRQVVAAFLFTSLLACSSGGSGGGGNLGGNDDPGGGGGGGGGSGDPGLVVHPTLDATAAATLDVPVTGGSYWLTATDGTSYNLRVPDGALLAPERITMRPLASVPDLPMSGGLVGGVQLGPEGLRFLAPATLEVFPPSNVVSTTQATAFAYLGAGQNFHLTPAFVTTRSVSIPLMHFSAAGFGNASAADVDAQQARGEPDAGRAYEQQVAALDQEARRAGESITDPDWLAEVKLVFDAWGNNVIYPALTLAETDDTKFDAAAAAFLAWDRQRALLGLAHDLGTPTSRGVISLTKGMKNAFEKANLRCKAGDPLQVPRLLRRGKEAALLGLDIGWTSAQMLTEAQKCARFEVTFDSVARVDGSDGSWWTGHTRAVFFMRVADDLLRFEGTGVLQYLEYNDVNSTQGDRLEVIYTPGEIMVDGGGMRLDVPEGAVPDVWLRLAFPVMPVEDITYVDTRDGFRVHFGSSFNGWGTLFRRAYSGKLKSCVSCTSYAPAVEYSGFGGSPALMTTSSDPVWVFTSGDGSTTTYRANDDIELAHRPLQ